MNSLPLQSPPSPAQLLERYADNPSAYLALNEGTRHFRAPGIDGLVAYRPAGRRTLVQLGGVFAAPEDRAALLAAFRAFAKEQRRRIVAVQLLREDAELYARNGFVVNQFGANYARALPTFELKGKKHVSLRNKISRARRAGVVVSETPHTPELEQELEDVDAVWLRAKGKHVKELQLMVGQVGGEAQSRRRLFVARDETGRLVGYLSFSPVHGSRPGWLHDLSRRRPDAPPGVLELLVVTAAEAFRAEGAGFLHFGMTPFTSLDPANEVEGASPLTTRIMRLLAERGSAIYPAADQLAYKEKWALDLVEPEYIGFERRLTLRALVALLRVTNSL
jgi:lysylphosphatidylglycerol synthetase-like protein (DUF2156 family)